MNKNDFKNIPQRAKPGDQICNRPGCEFAVAIVDGVPQTHCHIHLRDTSDLYRLNRVEVINRLNEIRRHPDSHTLEVELALLRNILESILNTCNESMDFIRNSGTIGSLVDKIEKLLKSNVSVAQATGALMSIEEVVTIAQALVAIVSEYLDPDELGEVVERFQRTVLDHTTQSNNTKEV
jgi:putative heme degradation protein